MRLKEVRKITDIKEGDTLIITLVNDPVKAEIVNDPVKAEIVKTTTVDGTEIIFNKKENRFFNLGMYLEGKSWVKEVKIVV